MAYVGERAGRGAAAGSKGASEGSILALGAVGGQVGTGAVGAVGVVGVEMARERREDVMKAFMSDPNAGPITCADVFGLVYAKVEAERILAETEPPSDEPEECMSCAGFGHHCEDCREYEWCAVCLGTGRNDMLPPISTPYGEALAEALAAFVGGE